MRTVFDYEAHGPKVPHVTGDFVRAGQRGWDAGSHPYGVARRTVHREMVTEFQDEALATWCKVPSRQAGIPGMLEVRTRCGGRFRKKVGMAFEPASRPASGGPAGVLHRLASIKEARWTVTVHRASSCRGLRGRERAELLVELPVAPRRRSRSTYRSHRSTAGRQLRKWLLRRTRTDTLTPCRPPG